MDNYIYVGKVINTFGIKGEIKVNSDFEYKNRVFIKDFVIYVGINKIKEVINSHRVHKNNDLINFIGYDNINQILKYKNEKLYILRSDLNLKDNEYLLSDLIGFEVYDDNKLLGIVIDYINNPGNILLKVKGNKTFYLPKVDVYIKDVNINKKIIITNKGSDLII